MSWVVEFWSYGRWNTYPHAGPFADEASAKAFVHRLRVNQRKSGLPGCEYRVTGKERAA